MSSASSSSSVLYCLLGSWAVTIIVCAVIRSTVASFQVRQIESGGAMMVGPQQQEEGATASHAHPSAITERELLALQRTPTFQLWAEGRSRQLTKAQLAVAQRVLGMRVLATMALIAAVTCAPWNMSAMESATSIVGAGSSGSEGGASLLAVARAYDAVIAMPNQPVFKFEEEALAQQRRHADDDGLSPLYHSAALQYYSFGPMETVAIASIIASVGGALVTVASAWKEVKVLSSAANSLLSFLATTNHDPCVLAARMNAAAVGKATGRGEGKGASSWPYGLLVAAVLLIRFADVAVQSFLVTASTYAAYAPLSAGAATAAGINGGSIGFITTVLAVLALICS